MSNKSKGRKVNQKARHPQGTAPNKAPFHKKQARHPSMDATNKPGPTKLPGSVKGLKT
jgi:hypothetical protein